MTEQPSYTNPEGPLTKQKILKKVGLRELKIQSEMRDHLDNKTGVVLGFALVAVVEILGLLLLAVAEKPSSLAPLGAYRVPLLCLTIGGTISVVLSVIFGVLQLRPMDFEYVEMDFLDRIQPDASSEEIQRRLVSYISDCIDRNGDINETKSKHASAAAICAAISIVFFAVGVIVTLFAVLH